MNDLGRAAHISPEARAVYRALIDALLHAEPPVNGAELVRALAEHDPYVAKALAELERADWLTRDRTGELTALYPFALDPTGVSVVVDGVERPVMCAIDALGVAPLLGRQVEVHATCAACGAAVKLSVAANGVRARQPRDIVVVRRLTRGPAQLARCAATRFACSPAHADAWLREHGGPDDVLLSVEVAFIEARQIFGAAYRG